MKGSTNVRDTGSAADDEPVAEVPPPASGGGDVNTSESATGGGSNLVRTTFNMPRAVAEVLEALSARTGMSKTDLLNRSVKFYAVMEKRLDRNNGELHLVNDDGTTETITVL